jgi:glucosamine-6-phosphate deaminase
MQLEEILSLPLPELLERARAGVRLFPDVPAMIERFAASMVDELRANNARREPTRWILPVGPVAQYYRVVEICNRERLSWKNVFAFQMDDFLDWQGRRLALDHPLSFEGFMRREVFARLDAGLEPSPEHLHFPDPFAPDAIGERIRQVGGIDTCFGGVGYHGHIAFNDPPISRWYKITVEQMRNSLTRVVPLADDSIVVQSINSTGGSPDLVPSMAITLGMKDILASRKIRLFLAGGERHRAVFRITLLADPTADYPSTLVQGHADCIVHTDEATARPIRPTLVWGVPGRS